MITLTTAAVAAVLPLTNGMQQILSEVEHGVLDGKLGPVTSVGISLAAFCAAFSLIKNSSGFLKGSHFDWWGFVRPIVIFLIVCNFSTIVVGPLRRISNIYNVRLTKVVGESSDTFKSEFKKMCEEASWTTIIPQEDVTAAEGSGGNFFTKWIRGVGDKLTRMTFKINASVNLASGKIIAGIMFFLLNIYTSVFVIIARVYLVLMALIGPFTFAISILPSYHGGIKLWVERYIQYTLWEPLLSIAMYIMLQVMIAATFTAATDVGGVATVIFLMIAVFVIVKQVPTIASFIIESTGTAGLANQMAGTGMDAGKKTAMILKGGI